MNQATRWVAVPALMLLGAMASAAGCSSKDSDAKVALEPTYENIHKEVLLTSCAFSSCHGGDSPAAGLNFSEVTSCSQLVWRDSCVRNDRSRVVPGAPEDSYLYSKVTATDLGTPMTAGECAPKGDLPTHMPPTDRLSADKIELIRAWIDIGAPCNAGVDTTPVDAGMDAEVDAAPDASIVVQPPVAITSESPTVGVGKQAVLTVKLAGAVDYGPTTAAPKKLAECAGVPAGAACCTPELCQANGLALCSSNDSCVPNGGQQVQIKVSNPAALAVPPTMLVPYSATGNDTGQLAVQGIAEAKGVVVTAWVGDTSVSLTLDVVP
ncbi:MAG: hypothetical protein IT374_08470 [Polyangiaceae bacterium]|nr:hypothetical protein [Polyangiaceae bacterium]